MAKFRVLVLSFPDFTDIFKVLRGKYIEEARNVNNSCGGSLFGRPRMLTAQAAMSLVF